MYDLIVLGGGPAGYLAGERAGAAGLKTVVVEKKHLGGVCLNEGCIPSKTLLNCARIYGEAQHSKAFGVTASDVQFDIGAVMSRKTKVVQALRKGVAATLKKLKVEVVQGNGRIAGKKGDAFVVDVDGDKLEGKRLLICTGSEAIRIPIPGYDLPYVYTNREILDIDKVPESLTVIGGGVIGLEFATFFSEIGTNVTVVEMLPSVGGPIDPDIASVLRKELERKGVTFHLQAKVTSVKGNAVEFEKDGSSQAVPSEVVLMSVGRRPVTRSIGLETINVHTENNAIAVDDRGRTNVPNVWAAGDVNGKSLFAHTAYREAEVCVSDMTGAPARMRYNAVPAVIYTHPEAASVGMTQAEAEKKGYEVSVTKLPMSYSGRYLAENEAGRGICKIIVEKNYRTLLGVHMVGGPCSEIIYGAGTMIETELRVDDIKEVVFPHPTVGEILREAIWHAKV